MYRRSTIRCETLRARVVLLRLTILVGILEEWTGEKRETRKRAKNIRAYRRLQKIAKLQTPLRFSIVDEIPSFRKGRVDAPASGPASSRQMLHIFMNVRANVCQRSCRMSDATSETQTRTIDRQQRSMIGIQETKQRCACARARAREQPN